MKNLHEGNQERVGAAVLAAHGHFALSDNATTPAASATCTEAEEYLKRAEECLRSAGACIAESNRQILVYAAVLADVGRRRCRQERA